MHPLTQSLTILHAHVHSHTHAKELILISHSHLIKFGIIKHINTGRHACARARPGVHRHTCAHTHTHARVHAHAGACAHPGTPNVRTPTCTHARLHTPAHAHAIYISCSPKHVKIPLFDFFYAKLKFPTHWHLSMRAMLCLNGVECTGIIILS